jgi:hypothetical protein
MHKLKKSLLQLLYLDAYSLEIRELRMLVHSTEPLQVTDDLINYFELSELQSTVSSQMKLLGSRSACISVSSGQLIYKRIPHLNQWFWDISAESSRVKVEPIPDGIVPRDLRPVSYDSDVQKALVDRTVRENNKPSGPSKHAVGPITSDRSSYTTYSGQSSGADRLLSPFELSPYAQNNPARPGVPIPSDRQPVYEQTPQVHVVGAYSGGSSRGWVSHKPQEVIDVFVPTPNPKNQEPSPYGSLIPETSMFGSSLKQNSGPRNQTNLPVSDFRAPFGGAPNNSFGVRSEPLIEPGLPGNQRPQGFPLSAKRPSSKEGDFIEKPKKKERQVVEDLCEAVKAGIIKWEDIGFSEETIKYAKENYGRLKAN